MTAIDYRDNENDTPPANTPKLIPSLHTSPYQAPPIDIGANCLHVANPHASTATDTIQDQISGAICGYGMGMSFQQPG